MVEVNNIKSSAGGGVVLVRRSCLPSCTPRWKHEHNQKMLDEEKSDYGTVEVSFIFCLRWVYSTAVQSSVMLLADYTTSLPRLSQGKLE